MTAAAPPEIRVPRIGPARSDPASLRAALARVPRHDLRDVGGGTDGDGSTRVSLAATREALVVLFEAVTEPPVAVRMSAGGPVYQDECFEVFVSEAGAPTTYREVVVNPAGAVYSARVVNPDDSRATWTLAAGEPLPGLFVHVEGSPASRPPPEWTRWSCLLVLPFSSLAWGVPAPGDGPRRANAFRIARGITTRFLALSPTGRGAPPDFHVPSRFARLVLEVGPPRPG